MIIILLLAFALACYLCFRIGIREGRYLATASIKEAYHSEPLKTRDFLIGETEELPQP